jgi:hypothetical protein
MVYRVAEASALVGLSEREGWRRVACGDWASVKCGRVTLIPAVALENWLRRLDEQYPRSMSPRAFGACALATLTLTSKVAVFVPPRTTATPPSLGRHSNRLSRAVPNHVSTTASAN